MHIFLLFFFFYLCLYLLCCTLKPRPPPLKSPKNDPLASLHFSPRLSFSELYNHSISSLVDDWVLFPATIPYTANNLNTGTNITNQCHETAYIHLMHKCHQLEEHLCKEKEAHNVLKYVYSILSFYSKFCLHVGPRMTHNRLVNMHNTLMVILKNRDPVRPRARP